MIRLTPGADTLSICAAPLTVPVTMTARITSIWRRVSMAAPFAQKLTQCLRGRKDRYLTLFGAARNTRRRQLAEGVAVKRASELPIEDEARRGALRNRRREFTIGQDLRFVDAAVARPARSPDRRCSG
jgi:hypothetical protein